TCSVGIATQDPRLRERYTGKPEDVVAYFTFVAEGVRRWLAKLGVRSLDELVGRVDLLRVRDVDHPKASTLDLSGLIAPPVAPADVPRRFVKAQPWSLDDHVDHLIGHQIGHQIGPQLGQQIAGTEIALPIDNTKRAAGTLLSGKLAREHGAKGLPDGAITVRFTGSAGQSFGAF